MLAHMNAKHIVNSLKALKGQHVSITWKRQLKTLKRCTVIVEKETRAFVRTGIDYANLASVKEGIEAGEREDVQPLPDWCEWVEFPFILRHKENGTEYVRLYPSTFANLRPSTRYFVNGKEANVDEVHRLCLASEFRERDEAPACFMVKAESISEIN